jgi:hypothetical protein
MGNNLFKYDIDKINTIHENIELLQDIAINIKETIKIDDEIKQQIINLYKTFYYPRDSLDRLNEMNTNHGYLRYKLKNYIKLYNEYNKTTIDEKNYVVKTYENIKNTLYLINV